MNTVISKIKDKIKVLFANYESKTCIIFKENFPSYNNVTNNNIIKLTKFRIYINYIYIYVVCAYLFRYLTCDILISIV